MTAYLDCLPCFLRQGLDAIHHVTRDESQRQSLAREVLRILCCIETGRPPPWVSQRIHRRIRELTGSLDPYREAKMHLNQTVGTMLPELRERIRTAPDPLVAAVRVAMVANAIDLGAKTQRTETDATQEAREACSAEAHGDFTLFHKRLENARRILYLSDNAGELAFDRLLIEQLGPHRVTLGVRGSAVINDATLDDAEAVGLSALVPVLGNGSDAPGTLLEDCSAEFRDCFARADLIIAKGQGNYETLRDSGHNAVFLLKVKCPTVAMHINLPAGTPAMVHAWNTTASRQTSCQ